MHKNTYMYESPECKGNSPAVPPPCTSLLCSINNDVRACVCAYMCVYVCTHVYMYKIILRV